ncbi:hypothetical protein FQN57_001676 [Myotisia sp. PD_48]|nr:hypothetical protein FQN57_001676 [Myotisia sp. PD_48]
MNLMSLPSEICYMILDHLGTNWTLPGRFLGDEEMTLSLRLVCKRFDALIVMGYLTSVRTWRKGAVVRFGTPLTSRLFASRLLNEALHSRLRATCPLLNDLLGGAEAAAAFNRPSKNARNSFTERCIEGLIFVASSNLRTLTEISDVLISEDSDKRAHPTGHQQIALMAAIVVGNQRMIRHTIDNGADINYFDSRFGLPLHAAVASGNTPAMRYLLENGARPDKLDHRQRTALHFAAIENNAEAANILAGLLETAVNHFDANGWTALQYAVKRGHENVVRVLLTHELVDPNIHSGLTLDALLLSVSLKHENITKLLLHRPDMQMGDWLTPLILAVLEGAVGIAELLLPHHSDYQINEALLEACSRGKVDIAKLLLQHPSVDINFIDLDGSTALIRAVRTNQEQIVKLLLTCEHLDVNYLDEDRVSFHTPGKTCATSALGIAAKHGNDEMVATLLSHPCIEPEIVQVYGYTPFSNAVDGGNLRVVRRFFALGVDINPMDRFHHTPIVYATKANNIDMVTLLLQHPDIQFRGQQPGRPGRQLIVGAYLESSVEALQLLLKHHDSPTKSETLSLLGAFVWWKRQDPDYFKISQMLFDHLNSL